MQLRNSARLRPGLPEHFEAGWHHRRHTPPAPQPPIAPRGGPTSADDSGSVTHWLGALRGGDHDAAQPLWERYFARLVRLAQARLRSQRRPGAVEDELDAALSAFDSICRAPPRAASPGWTTLTTSGGCWSPSPNTRPPTRCAARAPETRRWPGPHRGRPDRRRLRRPAGWAQRDRRHRAQPRVRRGIRRRVSSPLRGLAPRGCGAGQIGVSTSTK